MTRIEFWEPSPEDEIPGKGTARARFASHAFDSAVGKRVPFRSSPGGPQIGWATVVSVTVDDDGLGATWTADVDFPAWEVEKLATVASVRADSYASGFAWAADPPAVPRNSLEARPPVIRDARPGD